MSCAHDASLGDLLLALEVLSVDDADTACRVAALLGLRGGPRPEVEPDPVQQPPLEPLTPTKVSGELVPPQRMPYDDRFLPQVFSPTWLQPEPKPAPAAAPAWLRTPVPPETGAEPEERLDPLLPQRSARAALGAALQTLRVSEQVDVEAFLDSVSRAQPISGLLYRLSRTLHRGAHVWRDTGPSMTCFLDDQAHVLKLLGRIVGDQRLVSRSFRRLPGWPLPERPQLLPPVGTPLLVLSDLGLGSASGTLPAERAEQWRLLAENLAQRRSPLLVLTVYPAARYPAALRQSLGLLQWDRLTAAAARHAAASVQRRMR